MTSQLYLLHAALVQLFETLPFIAFLSCAVLTLFSAEGYYFDMTGLRYQTCGISVKVLQNFFCGM